MIESREETEKEMEFKKEETKCWEERRWDDTRMIFEVDVGGQNKIAEEEKGALEKKIKKIFIALFFFSALGSFVSGKIVP